MAVIVLSITGFIDFPAVAKYVDINIIYFCVGVSQVLRVNNAKVEMSLKRVKIMVAVEEQMSLKQTKSSDQAVDRLANGRAA